MRENLRSVLVPLPPIHWGGLQAFAANLNAGLREAGWRWVVAVPPEAENVIARLSEAQVDVIPAPLARLRRSPWLSLKALCALRSDIGGLARHPEAAACSLVQAVGAHHPHGAMLARRLSRPLVWQIHSSILPKPARRMTAPLIAGNAQAVMTNGENVAKAFWPRQESRPDCFVFYAPVDPDRFAPNEHVKAEVRHELAMDADSVIIGTVGNRVWQKNHEFLIRSAESLRSLYPRLRFLIAGEASDSYRSDYRRLVENRADLLNQKYPGYVHFVSPGRNVQRWLQAVDIFTLTSRAEGVPVALLEAMCTAIPVVSVNVGSIAEVVADKQTGYMCEPGDLAAYSACLRTLSSDPAARVRMGREGRGRILNHFSLRNVVTAHVSAYEAALQRFQVPDEKHVLVPC
jgi:glycosyltransferase involved in cell wall biosynthesis